MPPKWRSANLTCEEIHKLGISAYSRLFSKHWVIIGLDAKITQYALGDTTFLGGGRAAALPAPDPNTC